MKKELMSILKEEYNKGLSFSMLSKKYQISKSTIYYNLSKNNVSRRRNIIKSVKKNDLSIGTFIGLWAGDGSKFIDRGSYVIKIHLHKNDKNQCQFIKFLILELFNKETRLYLDGGNRASIKFYSKFVYKFIDEYLTYFENKTLTVRLKNKKFSNDFIKGFLLGLVLSDGYIKDTFVFSTTSENLAEDTEYILNKFKFNTLFYKQQRKEENWNTIIRVKIRRNEINNLKTFLNKIINNLNYVGDIENIKYNQNLSTSTIR